MNDKPMCCVVAGPPKKVAYLRAGAGYIPLSPALSAAIAELLGADANLGDAPQFIIREESTADNMPPTIDVARLKQDEADDVVPLCGRKRERERRAQQKAMERLQRKSSPNRKRR